MSLGGRNELMKIPNVGNVHKKAIIMTAMYAGDELNQRRNLSLRVASWL
jgi:hypothetical protein